MSRTINPDEFIPHSEPVSARDIRFALADLRPVETTPGPRGGLRIDLPHTRREDGTVDTIDIGPHNPGDDWMIYFGRDYGGVGWATVTATVGRCPGHMVILVVRALYAHLTAVGPQGRTSTYEGDILFALGLVRPLTAQEG